MTVANMSMEIKTGLQHSHLVSVHCRRSIILYWQHLVVLGNQLCTAVEDDQSVNTQLPTADDKVWLL